MVVWPSGKAVDCKSSIPSSNLGAALQILNYSIVFGFISTYYIVVRVNLKNILGNVVELVDTTDLKSVA
jgi:hypothetical protein